MAEAGKDDERDIIAKPIFIERVKILTEGIKSLDSQITTYNESVPTQFRPSSLPDAGATANDESTRTWNRLALTAPCLFVRGLSHHIQQNFRAAINDWEAALKARGANSISVDANYWIGYLNNTLGNFERATAYLDAAATVAPARRKTELKRLEIETRFFALDYAEVPDSLLKEGKKYFDQLGALVTTRAKSSFATTMGNISLIRYIRTNLGAEFTLASEANHWFEQAVAAETKSRWARFGICQNLILAGRPLNTTQEREVRDVVRSVGNEYQNRQEHRSKALSKITEYICMLMLKQDDDLSTIASSVLYHTSEVTARTLYSQFRKQNIDKDVIPERIRISSNDKRPA
jgi:tetratricopeptide (TPR) repeat protein